MSQRSFTRVTCDRCGLEDEVDPQHWARIEADYAGPDRSFVLRREADPFDMCPDCARSFVTWWSHGKPGLANLT